MIPIEGEWKVDRVGGLLPPMVGIWKRIRGGSGETRIGLLPVWPFRCERKDGGVALIYRWPFSGLVDEVRPEPDGSWLGRSTLLGLELGTFRMVPMNHHRRNDEKRGGREHGSAR